MLRENRTHCNAAMLSPSWRGGSTATTSALRNTRFDEYDIGFKLCCPQPLQGLERWSIYIEEGKQRSDSRHDEQICDWTVAAFIYSAKCCCLQENFCYVMSGCVFGVCDVTPTSGCTSTIHILFLACTERIASILVPYWFSLYSPCSMNLSNKNTKYI